MKKNSAIQKSTGEKVVFSIAFILFALYAFTIFYAFGFLILSALKIHEEFVFHMFELPQNWLFKNFILAFDKLKVKNTNMLGMLFNRAWYTLGGTILSVGCAATLSYTVSKFRFFGRNLIYSISVVVLVLPIVGSLPATYKLVKEIGIDNSPLFLLTFTSGFGFNFIVLYGYFKNLSWSYAEAAYIDGASDFQTFVKVMLPQALPAIVSLIILAAIGLWNDYERPLLFLSNMPTLSVGLYDFNLDMKYNGDYPTLFAGLFISVLPILIIFIVFQSTIMSNTVAGGLKG